MKFRNITGWVIAAAMFAVGLCACENDDADAAHDLFSPRMLSDYPKVDGNSILYVWYEVHDAQSYSIELSYSETFDQIIRSEEYITDAFYTATNLYYDTDVYARVKAHSAASGHDSKWQVFVKRTDVRDVTPILHEVDPADIAETSVRVTWDVTDENPANLLTVKELANANPDDPDAPAPLDLRIELNEEQFAAGEYLIEGLKETTTYEICLHNTLVENVNDQPYNKITVKTGGAPEGSIAVKAGDDLSAILKANEKDSSIQEGQVYSLAAGATFTLEGYEYSKGFVLEAQQGVMPEVTITKAFTAVGYTGVMEINGVKLIGENAFITGNNYDIEGVVLKNCYVTGFPTQFIYMTVSAGNSTEIQKFEVDNTIFDQMTTNKIHLVSMDSSYDASTNKARLHELYFTNSTIMRSPTLGGVAFITDNACDYDYYVELDHVTVVESCTSNTRFIHINGGSSGPNSKVKVHNFLLSNENTYSNNGGVLGMLYETALNKAKSKDYANNYRTTGLPEISRGSAVNTVDVGLTQSELFEDAANGDLTIKATDSEVYTKQIGDPRWIK